MTGDSTFNGGADETRLRDMIMRATQIQVVQAAGLTGAANLLAALSAAALCGYYAGAVSLWACAWLSVMLVGSLLMIRCYFRLGPRTPPDKVRGTVVRQAELIALVLGLSWMYPIFWMGQQGSPSALFFAAGVQLALPVGLLAAVAPARRLVLLFGVPPIISALVATYVVGPTGWPFTLLAVFFLITIYLGSGRGAVRLAREMRAQFLERKSSNQLRSAIEAMSDGVAILDSSGAVLLTNSAFRASLGGEVDLRTCVNGGALALDSGVFETKVDETPEGTKIYHFKDITARAEREASMARALEEAESAERTKTRFLESMSSELQTPLEVVLAFARLMSQGSNIAMTPTQVHQYSTRILESGEFLMRMLDDIMAYAELGEDHAMNASRAFDPRERIQAAARLARLFNEGSDRAEINLKADRSLGQIIVAPLAFERILVCLLSNAIKFGGPRPKIEIIAGVTSENAPFVSVRDWGRGIPAQEADSVFDPFFKGGREPGVETRGVGLGLTISKKLAQANGGDISMQSVEGLGTSVVLAFAANRHIAPSVEPPAAAASA